MLRFVNTKMSDRLKFLYRAFELGKQYPLPENDAHAGTESRLDRECNATRKISVAMQ